MTDITLHEITVKIQYFCHPDHRNNNKNKSQWTITERQEIDLFSETVTNNWLRRPYGWGLFIVNGTSSYLGKGINRKKKLVVAKFWDSYAKDEWHGFPADHNKATDRPPPHIADDWQKQGLIKPQKLRKLMKGQKCKL